jgi:hypothetical protein
VCALLAGGVWWLRARVRRPAAAMLGAGLLLQESACTWPIGNAFAHAFLLHRQ